MSWIAPITDRTASDVAMKNSKGMYLANDLNRVEEDCGYLAEQLNSYGYYVNIIIKTNWNRTDLIYKADLDRIRSNIQDLIDCYSKKAGSPNMDFTTSFNWEDANSLEQNLANIDALLQRMVQGFRRCGGFNFYSGSEVILP